MILCAGLGTRMRPLTLERPKPLLEVGGRSMLDHALDRLQEAGITRVMINTHYLASSIEQHVKIRAQTQPALEIITLHEPTLLDTGGGVKNALPYFEGRPFFVINADLPWRDEKTPALHALRMAWDEDKMDALLLLMETERARGFQGKGDFVRDTDGRTHRHDVPPPYPYVMLSAHITKPENYEKITESVFSNRIIWDAAEAKGRLYGIIHDGTAYHVGTPEDIADAHHRLSSGLGW